MDTLLLLGCLLGVVFIVFAGWLLIGPDKDELEGVATEEQNPLSPLPPMPPLTPKSDKARKPRARK